MDPSENRRNPGKQKKYYDYTMLLMVIALIAIGVIMISSISSYNAAKYEGSSTFYTDRQILYAAIGIVIMTALSLVDYRLYALETPRRKWPLLIIGAYFVVAAAQAAVIVLGRTDSDANGAVNGASRWIAVGRFKIQPGEFAKLFVIVIAAYWLCRVVTSRHRVRDTILFIGGIGVIAGLALVESLTTAIVIVGITGGLLFACSKKKLLFVILIVIGAVAAFILVQYVKGQDTSSGNFRMRRVYEWVHLKDADNDGQVKQGLYALASGGLFGKGLGQSAQKLGHIPEVHTDMIFACIVEELGLVGGAALIILFLLLLWRIAIVAINAPDLYGTLLCYGVMIHIGLQVCINIAVVTGTFPSTGVTLPFISYGGSSLLVLCAECGVVLNISRNIGYRKRIAIAEPEDGEGEREPKTTRPKAANATRKPFGGLRKVKDDHKRKRPTERGSERSKKRRAEEERMRKKSAERREEPESTTRDETPASGGYRMDVVLGQPSRKDRDGEDDR